MSHLAPIRRNNNDLGLFYWMKRPSPHLREKPSSFLLEKERYEVGFSAQQQNFLTAPRRDKNIFRKCDSLKKEKEEAIIILTVLRKVCFFFLNVFRARIVYVAYIKLTGIGTCPSSTYRTELHSCPLNGQCAAP